MPQRDNLSALPADRSRRGYGTLFHRVFPLNQDAGKVVAWLSRA